MSPDIRTPRGRLLERARPDAARAIVAIETLPEMRAYVGSWPPAGHATNLADPSYHYLVTRDAAGDADGSAILHAPESRGVELARIAVWAPGNGAGSDLLARVVAYAFDRLGTHRLQLDTFEDNVRAQRVYARAGFRVEGVLRDAARRGDAWVSLVLMALLANERPA